VTSDAGRAEHGLPADWTLDLGPLLDHLRTVLREQLLTELRADSQRWPEWMSVETAAHYLDVSPERVRKLQARRAIPFQQEDVGCRVFFARRQLDDWMRSQQRGKGS
jgi:excisionase family DNA binding protein